MTRMDRYWDALIYGVPTAILVGEVYALTREPDSQGEQPTLTNRSRRKLRLVRRDVAQAIDPNRPNPPMRPRYFWCALIAAVWMWVLPHVFTGRFNLLPRCLRASHGIEG